MKKLIGILICMLLIVPALSVIAAKNETPSVPIITGETNGKSGQTYTYSFISTDPDGDDINYCIDWGCGDPEFCIGPFSSGTEQSDSHEWSEGTYVIKVKAQDSNGAESEWGTLTISMPKTKDIRTPFLLFLENHPRILLLLQMILGL